MELQNVRRIAIFKMRNIGDVLMITPALQALRETFPEARITVVVNSGTEAMLAHNPHLDEVLVYRRQEKHEGWFNRLRYEWKFLQELRRRHFDLTIGFTEGDRTAWYTLLIGAHYRLGGVHYSIGKHDIRRRAYNMPIPIYRVNLHEVEKHFFYLESAGLKLKSTQPGNLCLVIPDDLRAWAKKQLAPLRPGRVIHVHPVSRWLWKCWQNESVAEVIDWLQNERKVGVVMTTGPVARERERAQEILKLCRTRPLFFDGDLSLSQTAALSAESDGYFGVDTAPMHMAAAVGVPVIALFGPTHAKNWGPWTPRAQVLSHGCPCHTALKQVCDWNQVRACMASITVEEAKAALDQLLEQPNLRAS